MVFQGQKLEKGWIVVGVESGDTPMVNWVMREQHDCVNDVKALACDLHESMRQRYANVPSYLEDLHNAFDLQELFVYLVGQRNSGGKAILDERRLEMWGREMFAKFCKYCAALPHIRKAIQEEDLEFYEELSHVYLQLQQSQRPAGGQLANDTQVNLKHILYVCCLGICDRG